MQISNAFWQVNEALSWFIGNFTCSPPGGRRWTA